MVVVKRGFGFIAAAALVAGLAAGCGSDDGSGDGVATDSSATPSASESAASETPAPDGSSSAAEPSATAAPASWSTCAEVWSVGAVLPKPYPGCSLDGLAVPAESVHCSMGALLVTYDNTFWGVPGHEISRAHGKLAKDPEFQRVRATCTA
ncbi:hypothetical protein GCM10023350_15420 [Nocardioides endophyticus]|uniref:Lipoprotein n=1 Tax=Nocardioides endophyticus TaxID=1353775 RepID=A0ABP8YKP7_9ACTN